MANSVNLTKRVMTDKGTRYCPAVVSANGRIKADYVVVNGKEERHPEGSYYIDWNEKGTRHRISVGSNPTQAQAKRIRKEVELRAVAEGIAVIPEDENRLTISDAVFMYLEDVRISKKPKTYAAYSKALEYFQESVSKKFMDEVDRRDMLHYAHYLREDKEQSPRTTYNKFESVITFLKSQNVTKLVGKNDWPRYVEEEPEVYEQEDLGDLYVNCTEEEKLWWDFFLMTGFREQEVVFCTWADVLSKQSTIRMTWKAQWGWKPKAYKEREVPVPNSLIKRLDVVRKKSGLVFPTESGKPKMDFLHCLKACARRGNCDVENFYLHKFRATFATWHLQAGIDLRTVQNWMGHTDLASTLRYLRPARGKEIQQKVNATWERRAG